MEWVFILIATMRSTECRDMHHINCTLSAPLIAISMALTDRCQFQELRKKVGHRFSSGQFKCPNSQRVVVAAVVDLSQHAVDALWSFFAWPSSIEVSLVRGVCQTVRFIAKRSVFMIIRWSCSMTVRITCICWDPCSCALINDSLTARHRPSAIV